MRSPLHLLYLIHLVAYEKSSNVKTSSLFVTQLSFEFKLQQPLTQSESWKNINTIVFAPATTP